MRVPDFLLALAMWLAWLIFWTWSARGNKEIVFRESDWSRRGQSVFMIIGGILIGTPNLNFGLFDQYVEPFPPRWTAALGLTLIVLGLAFTVWARICLAGNWSVTVTLKVDHELVSRGPYRLVRHPIYSGALLALVGTVLIGDQWRGLLGLTMVIGSLWFKICVEDRLLYVHFGDSYEQYRRRVPALIPSLRLHQ